MIERTINEGISFRRLMPFLTDDLKDNLASGKYNPKHYFKFRNEESYKAFINTIKADIYERKINNKPTLISKLFNFIQ